MNIKAREFVKAMIVLETQNLTKTYTIRQQQVDVLKNVSLKIHAGEIVAIVGSSGSGKTTLLSLLSALDQPSKGRVWVGGQDITDKSEDELAPVRNRMVGFVFQSFHLVPSLTAIENIMFPAELDRDPSAYHKAEQLMKRVGIWERSDNFPHQLSGGEKQRVAICRALINQPEILFADEPTGNLDSANSTEILDLLMELQREQGTTLVLVTHDMQIAQLADRIIQLQDGEIVPSGPESIHQTAISQPN
jgi:putative ABC transport system ATP-binding protein